MQVFVPISHCKDTHNFDKTNNFFKKVRKKEGRSDPPSHIETYRITLLSIFSTAYLTQRGLHSFK